jgi:phosphopantothenate---cysteine ligase (CTP)
MRVIITGGPASEPIDQVRVITNLSTGELAVTLSRALTADGHQVTLFLGRTALVRLPEAIPFSTNDELEHFLTQVPDRDGIGLVLHAAALSDFQVALEPGEKAAKISSESGTVCLHLVPKPKLLGALRSLFPEAFIVGWKLEMDGGRDLLHKKALRQMAESQTDACVINGLAFGEGFGFCRHTKLEQTLATKQALANFFVQEFKSEPR